MRQRDIKAMLWPLLVGLVLHAVPEPVLAEGPDVVVLGIDGMDPRLLERFVAKGRMPNFERLMRTGSYSPLQTSIPPQSPVAWSSFITGMDPGGHGIFDFIHRDVRDYLPTFSAALVEESGKTLKIGGWCIPLSSGRVEQLRRGDAFWQLLDRDRIPYLIFRIPANFPPVESRGVSVAGMGTPDLLGTYGTFSFYTDDPTLVSLEVSGGRVIPVRLQGDRIDAEFVGPENTYRCDRPEMTMGFIMHIDREYGTARIDIGDEVIVLEEGEWSDWIELEFPAIRFVSKVSGIVRLYLKSVTPYIQLYATPINIDPADPALPVSSDGRYIKRLYETIGHFYTQGMPEDTKALEWGIFDDAEFVRQSEFVLQERLRMLDAILDDYDGGLLFFYFSSIDQTSHMMWRNMDPAHPAHTPEAAKYADHIENLYARMDSVLGVVESRIPEGTTLVAMSDHGFAPYYKKVNLNTWLYQNGYLALMRPDDIGRYPLLGNVFWRRTRAYGLGINGLYVNVRGREAKGTVEAGEEYEALLDEISARLLAYRDPETGKPVVAKVYRTSEVYHGDATTSAPDLIVGYSRGYRCDDDSALGTLSEDVIKLNVDRWSGDHCMAYEEVPGILVINREVDLNRPTLMDLAATILALYGTDVPEQMVGRPLFGGTAAGAGK